MRIGAVARGVHVVSMGARIRGSLYPISRLCIPRAHGIDSDSIENARRKPRTFDPFFLIGIERIGQYELTCRTDQKMLSGRLFDYRERSSETVLFTPFSRYLSNARIRLGLWHSGFF